MPLIHNTQVETVELPLTTPFHTALRSAHSVVDIRVSIQTDDGIVGFGSASPTAKITGETTASIETALQQFILPALKGIPLDEPVSVFDAVAKSIVGNSSAKAAVDIALHDMYARRNGRSLSQHLNQRSTQNLATDATVSLNTPDEMEKQALTLAQCGFHALKIKLGGRDDLDILRAQRIRAAVGPNLPIRVDANQAWNVAQSIAYAHKLAELKVEFIEQPIYMKDLHGLRAVAKNSPLPIAADESVFDEYDLARVLDLRAAHIINLKLMKTGGIRPAVKMIHQIQHAGLAWMVGSMMEGPASVSAAAALAGAFKSTYADLDAAYFLGDYKASGGPQYVAGELCFTEEPGHGVQFL